MLPSTLNRMTAKPPNQFENLRIQPPLHLQKKKKKKGGGVSMHNRKKIWEP